MANARHGDQNPTDGDGLHVLHNFEPANAAALAALAVVAADIGKVARQVDTGDFYMLRSVGPSVWDKINGSGTGDVVGPASSIDDRLALFDGVTGKLLKQGTVTGSAVATHLPDTANPHATDLGNIGSGTLAELNAAVTDATLDDASDPRTPTAHASTHENGGGDEISVAGLSGLLADAQNPTAHAATHSDGGSDEIAVEDLATASTTLTHVLSPDGAGGLVMRAESGGVTTPGATIDLGVVVWDGLTGTAIGDAGIREYGKSATDPTVPTPADGDGYYNTALNMRMTYDGSRSKWLSERTAELWFGRSGNTGAGAYYRGPGNRAYSSTIGRNATHDGTIVSLAYTRADSDAATFQITADGVAISTLASAAQKGESVTLDNDFSAGAVLGASNASGGNTTQHVHGWAVIRWRA